MIWGWVFLCSLLFIFMLVLISKVYVQLYFHRFGEQDQFSIRFHGLFGLFRYHLNIPMIQMNALWEGIRVKENSEMSMSHSKSKQININSQSLARGADFMKVMLGQTAGLLDWLKGTIRHVTCVQVQWKTQIGLQDAGATAIAVGGVWATKSMLLGVLFKYIRFKSVPQINVSPLYHQQAFTTECDGEFSIRVWSIVVAFVRLMMRFRHLFAVKRKFKQLREDDNSAKFGEA